MYTTALICTMGTPIHFRTSFHRPLNDPPNPSRHVEATPSTEPPSPDSSIDVINRLRAENAQLRSALQQAHAEYVRLRYDDSTSQAGSEGLQSLMDELEVGQDVEDDSDAVHGAEDESEDEESSDGDDEDAGQQAHAEVYVDGGDDSDDSMTASDTIPLLSYPDPASEADINSLRLRLSRAEREIYANRQLSTIKLDLARRCLPRPAMLDRARPPWEKREHKSRVSKTRLRNMVKKSRRSSGEVRESEARADVMRHAESASDTPRLGGDVRPRKRRVTWAVEGASFAKHDCRMSVRQESRRGQRWNRDERPGKSRSK